MYGIYGAHTLFTPEWNWSGVINYEHQSFSAQHQWNRGRYGEAADREMEKEIYEEKYLTFAFRDKAIEFIEKNKEEPFFLYRAFTAPHIPFKAPVEYYCMYDHSWAIRDGDYKLILSTRDGWAEL